MKYLACLLLILFLPVLVLATTKTIICGDDASIKEGDAATNFGADTFLYVGYQGVPVEASIRSVLFFILDADSNWVSDSAILKIRGTAELTTTNYYIYIYTLSRNFVENQVSWDTAYSGQAWTTPGGDYNTSPKDSLLFSGPNTTYSVKLSSAMSESIEACINTDRDFYIELINKSEGSADSRKQFSSAEGAAPETLFVYGSTISGGEGGGVGGSPASPTSTIIYDGGANLNNYMAMESNLMNMAVRIPNKDTLVVCWQNYNDTGGTIIDGLVYSFSTDEGATWAVPKQIYNSTTARGSMIAVGDTIYAAVGIYPTTPTNDTVRVYKFTPGGTPSQVGIVSTTLLGAMPNITHQNGDTFWVSFTSYFTSGTANERCSLYVYYSLDRCQNWTSSTRRVLGGATVLNGRTQILHTSGKRIVLVATGIVSNVNQNLQLQWRNDGDGLTTWKAAVNVDTGVIGWTAGAYLTPLDSNVIIHYAEIQTTYDSTSVKTWKDSDSSLTSKTRIWNATSWPTGKKAYFCNIGYAGDTMFAIIAAQATGRTSSTGANWTRVLQFKKSVNGTTWTDSTRMIDPAQRKFDAVFKKTSSTFTDYTTAADDNIINDLSFFGATTDTLFFGLSEKFNYVHFIEGTAQTNRGQDLTWKYYNGSTWDTLTLGQSEPSQDSFFTTASPLTAHQVWFVAPASWDTTTVNSVNGKYWIKVSTDTVYDAAIVMTSIASNIFQPNMHVFRNNPSTYFGIAYLRGGREAANTGDIMFAKYAITPPAEGKRNRTALIRLLGD